MSNSDKCSNKENAFSEEIDSKLDEILENQAEQAQSSRESENNSKTSEQESFDKTEYYIRTANAKILLDTLAPEVSENEKRKREHKDKLIKYVSIFLGAQFIAIFILIAVVIGAIIVFHNAKNDLPISTINIFFAFFGTYVTSVIIELICILKYIVVNVFDTSISALMSIFKNNDNQEKKNEKI